MDTIPGFVTWTAGALDAACKTRQAHLVIVVPWDNAEYLRRRKLVADVYYKLTGWKRFWSSSAAQYLGRDGSVIGHSYQFSQWDEGRMLGRRFSYNDDVALEWLARIRGLDANAAVHVNADESRMFSHPRPFFEYSDIEWDRLKLPVQPPQPPCKSPA